MPLNTQALSDSIHSLLKSVPIGMSPESSIATVENADGTRTTRITAVMKPTYMADPMAKVIADAVATAVVTHLQSRAVVVGKCPPGTSGGPLIQGMIT